MPAAEWPADQIERRELASLIPYARNARKHGPRQIAEIAESMRQFGWTMPLLIDERGQVIAGHGRILAAERLGWTEGPVMVARGWTAAQVRAYRLADNEIAAHSTWDLGMLRAELADLSELGIDLELMGFAASDALSPEDTAKAGLPQALQLEPAREYVVVMCSDLDEWERLKVALHLGPVRRGGYKRGTLQDKTGTQRVVWASALLKLIDDRRGTE